MGHTEIPILMALLSCCVWKNVEVRTTPCVSGNGAMVFCSIWMSEKCGSSCIWVTDGVQSLPYSISLSLTSIHVRGSCNFCKCMLQLRPLATKSHCTHPRHKCSDGTGRLGHLSANTHGSCTPEASLRVLIVIFGSLRQVWACVGRENASLGAGMENKSQLVTSQ